MTVPAAKRRTRVLHIIQNLNYGGMERLLADIVRRVDSRIFESHVLVMEYLGRFAEGLEESAVLHKAPPMASYSMVWPGPLVRQIREIQPDVLHSHSGVWHKATLAGRLAGVPRIIHTEHGRQTPDPWLARIIDGFASRRTDVAVGVSDAVGRTLRDSVVQGRCRVTTVLNGVDTDLHHPLEDDGSLRVELNIAPDQPIIGSIGRLEHIKGYDYMIEAFARLCNRGVRGCNPVLVIAGDGAERTELERLAVLNGVASRTHLLGWRDDVQNLLRAFTLFTMSSRSEGTSVSLLEAMSSGICPIVTDVGGNAAVLGPALAHRLVAPQDPEALALAWFNGLSAPERRLMDAAAARARVAARYSLGQMVQRYQELYLAEP
jgi:glycosyltransferase involved in cell wall biosynthesis